MRWCDACGQPWLKDSYWDGWLLPLPPAEDPIPRHSRQADTHPAALVSERFLDEAWPPALWRPTHRSGGRSARKRTVFQVPALLTRAPMPLSEQPVHDVPPTPRHAWFIPPKERVAGYAAWCRICRELLDAPPTPAGGPWLVLHRSARERLLSTWTYPTMRDAFHAAAHLIMVDLGEGDGTDAVALDLFHDHAYVQLLDRYLELRPEIDLFEVAELVPPRADEF